MYSKTPNKRPPPTFASPLLIVRPPPCPVPQFNIPPFPANHEEQPNSASPPFLPWTLQMHQSRYQVDSYCARVSTNYIDVLFFRFAPTQAMLQLACT